MPTAAIAPPRIPSRRLALALAAGTLALAATGCHRRHHRHHTEPAVTDPVVARPYPMPTPPPYVPYTPPAFTLVTPPPVATAPDNGMPIPPPGVIRPFVNNGT
jgi:hypothetical protein